MLVGTHYLNLLNHSWPSEHLVVSLISGVYSSEIPTKSSRILTHPLMLANPAFGSTGPNSRLPPTSIDSSVLFYSVLSTALVCWFSCSIHFSILPPFFSLGPPFPCPLQVSWEISCASTFYAKVDKGILWLAHALTPTNTNITHRVTMLSKLYTRSMSLSLSSIAVLSDLTVTLN